MTEAGEGELKPSIGRSRFTACEHAQARRIQRLPSFKLRDLYFMPKGRWYAPFYLAESWRLSTQTGPSQRAMDRLRDGHNALSLLQWCAPAVVLRSRD